MSRVVLPFAVALVMACAAEPTPPLHLWRINLSDTAVFLSPGDTTRLTAVAEDSSGVLQPGATIDWTTDDATVATVNKGLVTGVRAGTTAIHATTGAISKTATVEVSVPGAEFIVANSPTTEEGLGNVAYDGTNYMAAVQTCDVVSTQCEVGAQPISRTGTRIGGLNITYPNTFYSSSPPRIAFDGVFYLMAWTAHRFADRSGSGTYARRLSKSGVAFGNNFSISFTKDTLSGIMFGGRGGSRTYLVTYVRWDDFRTNPFLPNIKYQPRGRIIDENGEMSSDLQLSDTSFVSGGFFPTAFDGAYFLTVYSNDTTIKWRLVTTAAAIGIEMTVVTASGYRIVGPASIAFNGTNFMIVFARQETGRTTVDTYAQLLTRDGAPSGGLIAVANDGTIDESPIGVIAAGSNFLVSYLDVPGTASSMRVRARFVSSAGAALGTAITIAAPTADGTPLGGVFHFSGSKYFAYYQRGVPAAGSTKPFEPRSWTGRNLYGALLTIPPP